MNFVEPILFQCRLQAPVTAMIAPGWTLPLISYGRLERFIHNIARQAQRENLTRGQTVALSIEEPILHAAFILGLTQLGVATVSARGTDHPKELHIDAVIADKLHPFQNVRRVIAADMSWTEGDGLPIESKPTRDDERCRIILTSGTTGDPKAIAFTHEMTLRRVLRHYTVFGSKLPECSRVFTDMGLTTSLGFFFLIHTLSRGGTVFFRGPDAIETLQALDLYKIQCMVASPAALAEFVDLYEQVPSLPTNFELVIAGGSLLASALSKRVRARMCARLVSAYGSTEASMTATAPAHAIENVPSGVGYITPGVTVEIVDTARNVLPANSEGLVRVRSEFAADGYEGDAEETRKVFRDGWFHSGDIGVLTGEGLLCISGREKTILNLGGDKVNSERIEQVLTSFPGVQRAAAFSTPNAVGIEELTVAVVTSTFDERALREHCEGQLSRAFVPCRIIRIDEIPVNEMGKVDRRSVMDLLKSL